MNGVDLASTAPILANEHPLLVGAWLLPRQVDTSKAATTGGGPT